MKNISKKTIINNINISQDKIQKIIHLKDSMIMKEKHLYEISKY